MNGSISSQDEEEKHEDVPDCPAGDDVNPQDATLPSTTPADFNVTVHDDTPAGDADDGTTEDVAPPENQESPSVVESEPPARRHKRPRGRMVRVAAVEEEEGVKGLPLPPNQYECTLYRRAERKVESQGNGEHGDPSLGMKLTVVAGKVIVQNLNTLSDGRASPAQLTGLIKRGDVLLSINGVSLVNLPIDQLMRGLSPLSTPNAEGVYQLELRLRFAAGEGVTLLERSAASSAAAAAAKAREQDGANEVFNIFPMVDQLSGMPLFDQYFDDQAPPPPPPGAVETKTPPEVLEDGKSLAHIEATLDETIASDLARIRLGDRARFISEYFDWREEITELLKQPGGAESVASIVGMDHLAAPPTKLAMSQLIERGRRAILGARALSEKVENVDRGKSDVRSFKSWSATLSRYSRVSGRGRFDMDVASLPVNFGRVEEAEHEESSEGSSNSDDEQPLDPDAMLLRLAATDEIWQRHVIEYLGRAVEGEANEENLPQEESAGTPTGEDMDAALSSELGNFLFGDDMTRILKKNKKSQALPPEDITALLFDLMNKLVSNIPDEIGAIDSNLSRMSDHQQIPGPKRPNQSTNAALATQFLLKEALPVLCKSFRPLPWEERRILWPLEKAFGGTSTAASTVSDDSLTLDSMSTNLHQGSPSTRYRKRKNLREMIEDQELNVETRAETCVLVTYYFVNERLQHSEKALACDFVKEYGSYLDLHPCFAAAALTKADSVIDLLVQLAEHDLRHKEASRQMARASSLVFYEPAMLSVLVQRLLGMASLHTDQYLVTIDLCAAAFPDVQPWQVRQACIGGFEVPVEDHTALMTRDKTLIDLYYIYLSHLMHPTEGHEIPRHDVELVKEWCELSILQIDYGTLKERPMDRIKNFYAIASRASSYHLAYARDLVLLLTLASTLSDPDLSLDVAGEIVESDELSSDTEALRLALTRLRTIALGALDAWEDDKSLSTTRLKRILRLYHVWSSPSPSTMLDVPKELLGWLQHQSATTEGRSERTLRILNFIAEEAFPADVFETVKLWSEDSDADLETAIIPLLRTVLRRAAFLPSSNELSGALMRLRLSRQQQEQQKATVKEEDDHRGIWKRMSTGMLTIAK